MVHLSELIKGGKNIYSTKSILQLEKYVYYIMPTIMRTLQMIHEEWNEKISLFCCKTFLIHSQFFHYMNFHERFEVPHIFTTHTCTHKYICEDHEGNTQMFHLQLYACD